eukprot:scaffold113476_cov34-Attheya_sp.AAC.1
MSERRVRLKYSRSAVSGSYLMPGREYFLHENIPEPAYPSLRITGSLCNSGTYYLGYSEEREGRTGTV